MRTLDDLGELQRAAMEIAWSRTDVTVGDVRDALGRDGRDLAYTTVLSVLQKLEKRGWLTSRREGRANVYTPARSRSDAGRGSVRGLVDRVFGGRPAVLMQHLVTDERLTADELARLRSVIDERMHDLDGEDDDAR